MNYRWNRILRRLQSHWVSSLTLVIMMAIGASVLCMGMNRYFSAAAYLRELELQSGSQEMSIEFEASPERPQGGDFLPQQFEALVGGDFLLDYARSLRVSFLHPDKEIFQGGEGASPGVASFHLLFLNERLFEKLGLAPIIPGQIYAGSRAFQNLQHFDQLQPGTEAKEGHYLPLGWEFLRPQSGRLTLADRPMAVLPLSEEASAKMPYLSHEQRKLEDFLVLPLSVYGMLPEVERLEEEGGSYYLSAWPKPGKAPYVSALIEEIKQVAPKLSVRLSNRFLFEKMQLDRTNFFVYQSMLLAFFQILLLATALSALLMMRMPVRSRDYAVSLSQGSTPREQMIEMGLEIALIMGVASMIGAVAAVFLLGETEFPRIQDHYHWQSPLLLFALAALMTLLAGMAPGRQLQRMSPVEILRKDT